MSGSSSTISTVFGRLREGILSPRREPAVVHGRNARTPSPRSARPTRDPAASEYDGTFPPPPTTVRCVEHPGGRMRERGGGGAMPSPGALDPGDFGVQLHEQ